MSYLQPLINVLLHPKSGWNNIAREEITVRGLYLRYILPWVGLIPLTMFITWASTEFPNESAGQQILFLPPKLEWLIIGAIGYLANVLLVPLTAFIADAKAAAFLGEKNFAQAMKVATFSLIPYWMTVLTVLVPSLSFLQLFALYSPYLLFCGLPILMKVPQEKAVSYTLTVVALTAAALLGVFLVVGPLVVVTLNSLSTMR
jgi:hypothetical protein